MTIISLFGLSIGLSPIFQWIIVLGFSFLMTKKAIGINQSIAAGAPNNCRIRRWAFGERQTARCQANHSQHRVIRPLHHAILSTI